MSKNKQETKPMYEVPQKKLKELEILILQKDLNTKILMKELGFSASLLSYARKGKRFEAFLKLYNFVVAYHPNGSSPSS